MKKDIQATDYRLQSLASGNIFPDSGWLLDEPGGELPGLVRAVYAERQLHLKDPGFGLYQFADWLPVSRYLQGSSAPVTYRSTGLAGYLGLKELYITFNGYWPEKGAMMKTCSFKETEAYSVCGRLNPEMGKILVVASAGNTARAFARVCSDNKIPLLLSVPEDNLDALWFDSPVDPCVKLIASRKGADYFDAIHLSNLVCTLDGFVAEGGAKNVARRDGMGTTVLSAVTFIGRIPDCYFQAVGSGTGAIAAWEANLRLISDGRFGDHKMKLMLSQNAPFHPIMDAWNAGSRDMLPYDDSLARKHVEEIDAKVLSNRKPPYPVKGGLFDAMSDAGGLMMAMSNDSARKAAGLFLDSEGIDIHPAAAVAVASLVEAAENKLVEKDMCIMLNITGGGEQRFQNENDLFYLKPDLVFDMNPSVEEVAAKVPALF